MKLDELQITKDTKVWGTRPQSILAQYGWTVLGAGFEGAVAEHPQKKYVLKLFNADSKYIDFINKIVKPNHGNPHLPRMDRFVRSIPGAPYFRYVRMEKLNPIPNDTVLVDDFLPEMIMSSIICKRFGKWFGISHVVNNKLRDFGTKYDDPKVWEIINKKPPSMSWIKTFLQIIKLSKTDRIEIDMHSGNFMIRGDTLVITDPFI